MKIAMVTTVGERCGIAAYSASLASSLRALPETEVEVVPISVGEQPPAHYASQAQRLNASDVDVVHIQHEFSFWGFPMPGRASTFAAFRRQIRRPVVVTAHTTLALSAIFPVATERNPIRWLRKKRLVSNRAYRHAVEVEPFDANATIVHTETAHHDFVGRRGLNADRVFVVPMGMPVPVVSHDGGTRFRDRYGLHGKRVLTLFGYISGNKGYEIVADVLSSLPADVMFVIAGGPRRVEDEAYVRHLEGYIRHAGVRDRIVVTGYLSDADVADAMRGTDIALVPHTQATNSYSVTFPLSHGRPTLASNLSCFREMAARGDCLELFESGDRKDFRRKLVALLDDDRRQLQLSRNASRFAEKFMWPNVAAKTREIYCAAINRHRAGV